ncbi:MAG: DMT family transporter [Alphaproteobacteria bacterium]|nr:DMT family transporter [Alphaproteobacteria bacterium]NCQ67383.1 DMT family transporter [Alphaproteobacteria bacterium]NCT06651.1 DMT family transporter [Alphaproteobacteria bacterium]
MNTSTAAALEAPLTALPFWKRDRLKQNTQGIIWKLLACAGFAGVNAFVRYLTGGAGGIENPLTPGVVALFQNIFGCLIMLPFVLKDGIKSFSTQYPFTHLIRVIAAVFGIVSLYTAFSKMPMAQAVALQFTGPIFSIIGAKLYLSEKIGGLRSSGIILGLIGAFIITRPDQAFLGTDINYQNLAMLLPIASAILFAVAKLCSRKLGAAGEKPQLLALYLLFFMIPVSGFYALYDWRTPDTQQLLILVALGGCGCLAHYATAKAYSLAEVVFLTPFGFARIVLTGAIGYILFSEFPRNEFVWYGISFIVLSVFAMTYGETHLKKQKTPAPC